MKKKFLAVVLGAAMVTSLVACGKKEDKKDDTTTTTPDDTTDVTDNTDNTDNTDTPDDTTDEADPWTVIVDADGNPVDLGGMEILIADWWTGEQEEPKTAYEIARKEYYDWIQETYNFTITRAAWSSWGDMPGDYVNYATTGGDENIIFCLRQGGELTSAMAQGLMYDLNTLDCLDFSESKWDAAVQSLGASGDKQFVVRAEEHEPTACVYFNKRLLKDAGIEPDYIYELQRNHEWTWDKFEEILAAVQADTDNDGVIDRYAMTNFTSNLYPAAVFSNGGSFIGKDADGKFFNNIESDATMEAMNWCMDILSKYEMPQPEGSEWNYMYASFANAEAVFFPSGRAYMAGQDFKNMEDDFGCVCFPMGPRMTEYTNMATDNVYCIPSCYDADKAWKIMFAYNLYTDPVPGFEDYSPMQKGYENAMRDSVAVDETIAYLLANPQADMTGCIVGLDLGPQLFWAVNKDNTPAQQAEAQRNAWAELINQANGQ